MNAPENPEGHNPVIYIVSSPSGAGKSTLCRRLLDELSGLCFAVSHTTRKPRRGEVNGRDYHFVTDRVFREMISSSQFLEWAEVHGNLYGTAESEIERAGKSSKDLLCDVDYQGAMEIKKRYSRSVAVFILPPSVRELKRRLEGRGTDSAETRLLRFRNARKELEHYTQFDFLVVNDDLEKAAQCLKSIVTEGKCDNTAGSGDAGRLLREFENSE